MFETDKKRFFILVFAIFFFSIIGSTLITMSRVSLSGGIFELLAFATFCFAFFWFLFGWLYFGACWKFLNMISFRQGVICWLVPVFCGLFLFVFFTLIKAKGLN